MTRTIIIEDNAIYRQEMLETLNRIEGVRVVGNFGSVEEGLDFLQDHNEMDLCILDIGLPGMDGVSGISEIFKIVPEIKISMITVFDDDKRVFEALKKGACGYLLKGEVEGRLESAIQEIMAGGSFFTPTVAQKVLKHFRKKPFAKTKLTKREKEVLKQMKLGLPKKQIADKMIISYSTVDTHVKNIYRKLHVNCGVQAVMKAIEEGVV